MEPGTSPGAGGATPVGGPAGTQGGTPVRTGGEEHGMNGSGRAVPGEPGDDGPDGPGRGGWRNGTGPGGAAGGDGGSGGSDGAGGSGATGPADGAGPGPEAPPDPADRVRRPAKKPRSFWKELPILVVIALALALVIKTFLVQAFSIPSQSMQNTLQVGDRVLVDKLTPWFGAKPSRGEVVVFHDPGGWLEGTPPTTTNPVAEGVQKVLSFIGLMPSAEEKDLIKRVIAVGGDTVECKVNGPVKVNGKALDEPYIYRGNTPCSDHPFGPIKVPPNRIWVMGDHRQDSEDSRYHQDLEGGGTVSDKEVVGRAIVVAWPVNRWSTLPVPSTFDQPGINSALAATPAALGFVGAVPLVLLRRRRLIARARK
ncbi:putative signal peptidase I [Streptantibioticus cattleyicolor NRRL 8057 = DSM 46488]|uniref:Signal peptidase I n=2 Tax=Kitasatosporales TaxID=85011 RepID=G8WXH5_STREN|nr:putative signal peptidase I [Streptantibioticus cattleyicolor NRRL 8057 = DSM 46488]